MTEHSVDLFVIGGGVNGAAIARDAAGRGLSVMLAEKGDYASGTSSASSGLIHGGLRYLESFEIGLVRTALKEREGVLRAAPYLAEPLRFLVPITSDQKRPAWQVQIGLTLYDWLAGTTSLPPGGRLTAADVAALPRLRRDDLSAVLHYHDCRTDDARLVIALLLDARERGADIANRRAVTDIRAAENGYRVAFTQGGQSRRVLARFVVNAAGPWIARIEALCDRPPSPRPQRLVRGSHIVLRMPEPVCRDAYTLQNDDGRVVFALPWLDARFLVIGTTDAVHEGDPSTAQCSEDERTYLLRAYNRYFDHAGGPAAEADIVWTWSGVRALADDGSAGPSKVTRRAGLTHRTQGCGGMITVHGGKLTTHRELAEDVLHLLGRLGVHAGSDWTWGAVLPGGHFDRNVLAEHAEHGPAAVAAAVRRRWAQTYGDRIMVLYDRIAHAPETARDIAPGVPEAELLHAREMEDAVCAEDFLFRRTKLFMTLSDEDRQAVERWFAG